MVVLVAGMAMFAIGCGGGGAKDAKTPKEACVNMTEAVETGDEALFLSAVHTEDEEMAKAMFGQISAMYDYSKKFEAEYGKAPGKGGKKMPTSKDVAEKVKIKEDGDKAVATMPGQSGDMDLVKKDGVWKVDISKGTPTGAEKEKALKMSKTMADVVKEVTGKIGTEGYTAEKIEKELGAAMMKAMMSSMGG